MRNVFKMKSVLLVILALLAAYSFTETTESSRYKCMIQMVNYSGEGAYIVISLINPEGKYEKTLYVHGDDDEWYYTVTEWWKFHGKKRPDIDAISGATISGGARKISIIEIENDKIDAGYSIRFETAVEDQEYYVKDIEIPLTSETVKTKTEGKGFIRYVRMMPN